MTRTKWRELYSEQAKLRYMIQNEEPDKPGCMGIAVALIVTASIAAIAVLSYIFIH